jgi:hypothetical protein
MVSARVGQRGVNLIDTSLIPLVQYEIAYRESAPSSTPSACGTTC